MPRRKRQTIPGAVYHLISRFVDRDWFINTESERRLYLTLLGNALEHTTWRCLGYAVMSNHIHLAVVGGTDALADWVRSVHSPFADTMNRSYGRIGPMFVRGPKDILVPDARVGQLLAYIHKNPVRAGVVAQVDESRWTSHRSYVGLAQVPPWLAVSDGLRRSGLSRAEFGELVNASEAHPVLGKAASDEHLDELVDAHERRCIALEAKCSTERVDARRLVAAVVDVLGMPLEQLRSRRRGELESRARAATIACGQRLGYSSTALAEALAVTPQAVNKRARSPVDDAEIAELVTLVMDALADVRE